MSQTTRPPPPPPPAAAAAPATGPPLPPSPPPPGAAAAPPPVTNGLADRLVARFPTAKVEYMKPKRLKVTVPVETAKDAALFARDELGFDHIAMVGGTDYPSQGQMQIDYFVESVSREEIKNVVFILAERVKRDAPEAPSLVEVWTGADYHERETFEMLGIRFTGHPDLRRLLLPEDWDDIPPLRKDYTNPGR